MVSTFATLLPNSLIEDPDDLVANSQLLFLALSARYESIRLVADEMTTLPMKACSLLENDVGQISITKRTISSNIAFDY